VSSSGLPLGIARQEIYQHSEKKAGAKKKELPIEDKESVRWLKGMKLVQSQLVQGRTITVCDREGDIFEVLSYGSKSGNRFVIRMCQDRITGENYRKSEGKISEQLEKAQGFVEVLEIYDQSKSKYVERKFEIRFIQANLPIPKDKVFKAHADCKVAAQVNVIEIKSIDGLEEIKWVLLTNISINTQEEALKIIGYYKLRWHIENYHKVLKSSFKVEEARLESLEGLFNLLSLLGVLAVKLYYLIHLSRVDGEKSCDEILEKQEWESLLIVSKKSKISDQDLHPPTVKEAIVMIAQLGGYMNRKRDLPPGIIVIWRGWLRLAEIAHYHQLVSDDLRKDVGNRKPGRPGSRHQGWEEDAF
jgi:hypothetical protein